MTYARERIGLTVSGTSFSGFILLGHLGFFWLLNSGLAASSAIAIGVLDVIKVQELAPETIPQPHAAPVPMTIAIEVPEVMQPAVDITEPDSADANALLAPDSSTPSADALEEPKRIAYPVSSPRWPLTPPIYPAASQSRDEEGRVVLDVYVIENGHVADARVLESSGYTRLDQAALEEVKRGWRLLPGTEDGTPTAMWVRLAVNFRLNKGR